MSQEKTTIAFMGDVMIGRRVNRQIKEKGFIYPWGNILAILQQNAANIINLETTLTTSQNKISKVFNFKSDPQNVEVLEAAKITAVNLANNHVLDFGEEGLIETIKVLNTRKILHTGAGINITMATEPAIFLCGTLKFAMLGFTDNERNWKAQSATSGINFMNINSTGDKNAAFRSLTKLKAEDNLFTIVSLHWGANFIEHPSTLFISLAHELIDHGADMIYGHSAHIFQAIEVYNGKLILYDTGDFIDDYQVDPVLRNDLSFLYSLTFKQNKMEELNLIPVRISDCQVNIATGHDRQWCMKRIQELSVRFFTRIKDGKIDLSEPNSI
ncbi:MAG TPA: CapA family protein [Flavisolibacter sp.]|nr:CapA family protein [Flavisolibacter sp.]